MGKDVGDDFRDGKVTLPVILAYARGSEDERGLLARGDGRRARTATRTSPTRSRLMRATTRSPTRSSAPATTASARSTRWRLFPPGKAKAALVEAVEFAVARAY